MKRLLNKYTQHRLVNGVDVEFIVTEYVSEEADLAPEEVCDDTDIIQEIKSGKYFIGLVEVRAEAYGATESDFIGGAILHSVRWQDDSRLKQDVAQIIDDHGMHETAIRLCTDSILDRAKRLAVFIKGAP